MVNGAAVPTNSALTSVGAELHLTPRWILLGKFDGEFASAAQTAAGSGMLRYSWSPNKASRHRLMARFVRP